MSPNNKETLNRLTKHEVQKMCNRGFVLKLVTESTVFDKFAVSNFKKLACKTTFLEGRPYDL